MEVAAPHRLQENCTQKDCQLHKDHSGLIKHVPILGNRGAVDYKYAGMGWSIFLFGGENGAQRCDWY